MSVCKVVRCGFTDLHFSERSEQRKNHHPRAYLYKVYRNKNAMDRQNLHRCHMSLLARPSHSPSRGGYGPRLGENHAGSCRADDAACDWLELTARQFGAFRSHHFFFFFFRIVATVNKLTIMPLYRSDKAFMTMTNLRFRSELVNF